MTINRNPVEAADAAVIAEMRAANAENKRKVIGPEAQDDSFRYAEKMPSAGLSVSLNVWEGMPHGFQAIASLGAADASLKEIGSFLQGRLSRTHTTA